MWVCLIWILYGYNWRPFFKILWTDERERPNSQESLRSDFFGLRATESRTVSTFSGNLAVYFLPLVENCPFLVDLINVPVFLNFCNLELIWKVIEIKPLTVSCLDSLQGFCPQIEGYTKCFFFRWPCHLLEWFWDVILLSINPEKYWIISLILVELLTSKWITFILKHPVDNWFDHFWLGFKSLINIFLQLINFCSILLVNITSKKKLTNISNFITYSSAPNCRSVE